MKLARVFLIIIYCYSLLCSVAQANSEQVDVNRELFVSVVDQDFEKFKAYLLLGADPNAVTEDSWYSSSAFCESTRNGNEEYLDYLIKNVEEAKSLAILGTYKTPTDCVIRYDNVSAFKKFVALGLDPAEIANPEVPIRSQRSLLDIAIRRKSPEIIWYLVQQIEFTDAQKLNLVRSLERFGGFENTSVIQYYEKLAEWLLDRGIEVNLAPPAPDPRTIVR